MKLIVLALASIANFSVCAQSHEAVYEQPHKVLTYEITKSDKNVKDLLSRWAKQEGMKFDWKFKYSDLSFLEVSFGSKRPDEYDFLVRGAKNIKGAIEVVLSQQLVLNAGQSVEDIYEPNALKACFKDKTITIMSNQQKCSTLE